MTNNTEETSDFYSGNLLSFLYGKRKSLLIIAVLAIIASSIVSGFIEPKYKSTVIIFPTLTNTVSRALLEEPNGSQKDYLQFGEEEQAEQTIQILNSDEIRDRIAEKYHLMKHYGIDANDPLKNTYLKDDYESNISFKRTEYMSIKIEVLDKDRDTAALIANDISAMLDSTKNRMTKERASRALAIVEKEYFTLRDEIRMMEDSLTTLRKFGIYEYEKQIKALSDGYAEAIVKGNSTAAKQLEDKLGFFTKYGGNHVSLTNKLLILHDRLGLIKAKYEEVKADTEKFLPYKFTVNNAYPAEKKSYPIRWLIVLVSTVSTILFSIVVIMIMENFSKIKS